MQPQLNVGITFTHPSKWVWHVSVDGKHVGTINGDSSCGFTARDIDHHSIAPDYVSLEAAMQACVHVMDSRLTARQAETWYTTPRYTRRKHN